MVAPKGSMGPGRSINLIIIKKQARIKLMYEVYD